MPASTITYSIIIEPSSLFSAVLFVSFFIRLYVKHIPCQLFGTDFSALFHDKLSVWRTRVYGHRTLSPLSAFLSILGLPSPALADDFHARNATGKDEFSDLDDLLGIGFLVKFLRQFIH